jgi:hypothetical protein
MQPIWFDLRTLRRVLDPGTVARGISYANQGRVHDRRYDPARNRYAALVQGTREDPYAVEVKLAREGGWFRVEGQCACPMEYNCKHVAAVLVDALRNQDAEAAEGSSAAAPATPKPAMPEGTQLWLRMTREAARAAAPGTGRAEPTRWQLHYVLEVGGDQMLPRTLLQLVIVRRARDGSIAETRAARSLEDPGAAPQYLTRDDHRIRRLLQIDAHAGYRGTLALEPAAGGELLPALVATGRLHYGGLDAPPLAAGAPRRGTPAWRLEADGAQVLAWQVEPEAQAVLPLAPPWYVDVARQACGPLDVPLAPSLAHALASAPRIPPNAAGAVREELAQQSPDLPLPLAPEERVERRVPLPHLYLTSDSAFGRTSGFGYLVHRARLTFDYAGLLVNGEGSGDVRVVRDSQLLRIPRDRNAEKRALRALTDLGMSRLLTVPGRLEFTFHDDALWLDFVANRLPQLRSQGWQIETDPEFRFQVAPLGEWYAQLDESGHDWFDLDLGVEVEGKRLPLLPILVQAVRMRPDLLGAEPDGDKAAQPAESLPVQLPDGRFALIPVERVRPVLSILHELLDRPVEDTVRLPRLDAARLADLEQAAPLTWRGGEEVRALGAKLASFERIEPVPPPAGLQASLRPYQLHGIAWLQFLREYGLNGILADDMGLGKTVQALAHILVEKESGRLAHPALVVCPTSLVPNWKAEAARFAPGLRVHVSHGLKRKSTFGRMADHDLVITTYPLLARDREVLLEQPFHLAILDEAQQIKNAQTVAAKVTGQIQARHRLCLTGTPLENHLGELWSLFNFLMPGFLGDARAFRAAYRTPIEKHGDDMRRASLVRRVRPFMLRRTKAEVATELPSKTEIVLPVEIEGAQRDLYETVRAAMDERVRREIAARGLMQSQIVVLDALLKLRQICCDPRLLKLQSAKAVKESAKLDALMELLDELLGGNHRVLLFSQFTSMLALIEQALDARGIRYVVLTGDTQDRATPVQAFQSGKVPLFLISLKAGGTGLNLTAADTVVHYDPWWNPAVENQATDRAHRIGQDKPVFVYKLIVAGSVEEKIAQLQVAKAALAEAVLGGGQVGSAAFTADDIAALFEPLQ